MGQAESTTKERFGEIAVRLGFCAEKDRDRALAKQAQMDKSGDPHELLGLVMLQMGIIGNDQLIRVLKQYDV